MTITFLIKWFALLEFGVRAALVATIEPTEGSWLWSWWIYADRNSISDLSFLREMHLFQLESIGFIVTTAPSTGQSNDWTFPLYPLQSVAAEPVTTHPTRDKSGSETDIEPDFYYGGGDSNASAPAAKLQPIQYESQAFTLEYQPIDRPAVKPAASPKIAVLQPVPRLPTTAVWGTRFARANMDDAIDLVDRIIQNRIPEYIITANLNYLMLIEENPELLEVNQHCCCILADGNPIVWRSRYENNPLPCRVAGSDMIVEIARLSSAKGYRIFFLGGAPGVADAAAEQLRQWYPEMQIAGTYSPPFRQLSSEEHEQMLQRIRDAKTDILLVAFGQPKGELWIYDNLTQLGVPLSIQLGASFDFLAGTAKRAPETWQKFGCEWLYRACSDPQRLFPRYGKNILFLMGQLMADAKPLVEKTWSKIIQPRLRSLLRRS